jgi:DNA repair protein RadC
MKSKKDFEKIKPTVRETAMEHGLSYLFNEELVMLILGTGNSQMPVEVMAEKIVGVLDDSDSADVVENLLRLKGVGQGKALAVAAALELGKRRSSHLCAPVRSSADVVPFVQNYAVCKKEHFLLVTLNGSHEIIQIHVVSVGTLNKTLIHPREIYGTAMKEDAAAIVVCHNHPSGNCQPSEEDIKVTHTLERVGDIMGIELLDHIIVCRDSYFSFLDGGLLLKSRKKNDGFEEAADFIGDFAKNIVNLA